MSSRTDLVTTPRTPLQRCVGHTRAWRWSLCHLDELVEHGVELSERYRQMTLVFLEMD
jgi:hypothetical protein